MRYLIFILIFFSHFCYSVCPPASHLQSTQNSDSVVLYFSNLFSSPSNNPASYVTVFLNNQNVCSNQSCSSTYQREVFEVCRLPQPVSCLPDYTLISGKYGVNFGCKKECPSGYSENQNAPNICKDANGCTPEQTFRNGICVNKDLDSSVSNCLGLAGPAGLATLSIDDTGQKTCIVGAVSSGTSAQCQQADGTACFANPALVNDLPGWQCGSFNSQPLCVASASTGAVGVGKNALGTKSTTGLPESTESQLDDGTFTTTTTTTKTPVTTQITSINNPSQPLKQGDSIDSGTTTAPTAPFVCQDGRLAANIISCDSAVTCPVGTYLAYGSCIKLPTRTTSTTKETVTTDVVKRDNATGQVVSSTTTNSSTTSPVKAPTAQEPQKKGECDPTAANYQQCVGLLENVSDTKAADIKTAFTDSATAALDATHNEQKTSIQSTSNGLGVDTSALRSALSPFMFQAPACQPMQISFVKMSSTIPCDKIDLFKTVFGWVLYIFTLIYLFHLFFKPVEQ